ncbi:MAG: hypothetical protein RL609_885 [Bacteroidota bacterium]|jgi:1,4-dihydroxy-2-naphthoate octaprenyltransferase
MKKWIEAARLRTLPLAASGILLGGMPGNGTAWNSHGFLWALITGILLQVLSNYANDYGDYKNGADQFRSHGPNRAVQSGLISQGQMLAAIVVIATLALISGSYLIYKNLLEVNRIQDFWIMLGIGVGSIAAAYTYTAGPKPYGYMGLGDISVFLFFGWVGVVGTHFVLYDEISSQSIWGALFVGAMSVSVLHLNNMRDMDDDAKALKHTLALRLGWIGSKRYLLVLYVVAFSSLVVWISKSASAFQWLALIPLIGLMGKAKDIARENQPQNLDPYLKRFALTCFFSICLLLVSSFL